MNKQYRCAYLVSLGILLIPLFFVLLPKNHALSASTSSKTSVGISILSTTPPAAPVYTITVNQYIATFTGTSIPNGVVHLTYSDAFGHIWSPIIVADPSGNWSYTSSILFGGLYTSSAYVVNEYTQQSPPSPSQSFTITLPTPSFSLTLVSGNNASLFNGTGGFPNEIVRIFITGPNGYSRTADVRADSNGNWSYVSPDLLPGTYTFSARVIDGNGTQGPLSPSQNLTVPVPTPTFVASPNPNNTITLNEGRNALPNGTVEITVTGPNGDTFTVLVTADGDGNWTYTTGVLSPGEYTFTARVIDTNGNTGTPSPAQKVTISVGTTTPTPPDDNNDGDDGDDDTKKKKDNKNTTIPGPSTPAGTSGGASEERTPETSPESFPTPTQENPIPPANTTKTPPTSGGSTGPMTSDTLKDAGFLSSLTAFLQNIAENTDNFALLSLALLGLGALSLLPMLFQLHGIKDVAYLGQSMFLDLFNFLAFLGKRREYGVVYSSKDGSPIPLAQVHLFDEYNRKVETRLSDSSGLYSFLVSPGKYTLTSEKEDYAIDFSKDQPVLYGETYHGQVLEFDKDQALVKVDVAMKPLTDTAKESHRFGVGFYRFFDLLFYFGIIANLVLFILRPSWLFAWVLFAYALLWFIRSWYGKRPAWGLVVGMDNKPKAFTIIRVFRAENQEFIAQVTSNELGRYFLLLNSGSYILQAVGVDSTKWSGAIHVRGKRKVYKETITLS